MDLSIGPRALHRRVSALQRLPGGALYCRAHGGLGRCWGECPGKLGPGHEAFRCCRGVVVPAFGRKKWGPVTCSDGRPRTFQQQDSEVLPGADLERPRARAGSTKREPMRRDGVRMKARAWRPGEHASASRRAGMPASAGAAISGDQDTAASSRLPGKLPEKISRSGHWSRGSS